MEFICLERNYVLEETRLVGSRLVDTHMDPSVKLYVDRGELLLSPYQYHSLVSKLNYLTITSPDISFIVKYGESVYECLCSTDMGYRNSRKMDLDTAGDTTKINK